MRCLTRGKAVGGVTPWKKKFCSSNCRVKYHREQGKRASGYYGNNLPPISASYTDPMEVLESVRQENKDK